MSGLVCVLCVLSRFSRVRPNATLWTVAHQAPLSLGFSRQEYWSGLPFPSWGDLPNPGIELVSPASPALTGFFYQWATCKACCCWSDSLWSHGLQHACPPCPLLGRAKKKGLRLSWAFMNSNFLSCRQELNWAGARQSPRWWSSGLEKKPKWFY